MSNLLYKEYKTGCYVGLVGSALVDYNYGDSSSLASYYADLEPNATYTLKRYDSSSRFRVATFTNDVKILTGSGTDTSIQQWWLSDSTDTITFTTGSTDIHLVVYYTNNSEYTTRVMLNTGSVADAYEAPTKSMYPPEWYMDGDQPTPVSALPIVQEHFTEPYPASLWQYEGGDTPINDLMAPILQERFTRPYPTTLWRIDDNNDGYPYTDLMLDVLYHEPEPPPPEPTNPEHANWLGHWFIRLNDIDRDKTSVMGYISRKADRAFKPTNFKNISNWNKSLQNLNDSYYQMLGNDILGGLIPWEYND